MPLHTNRNFKSSVFASYFQDKAKLIEVYNAIKGTNYLKDTAVQINTLDYALYLDQINDISFSLDDKLLILIEHQSTINPNMPLRLLLYVARVYEKILDNENLYKSTRVTIPKPEFLVLYNGEADYPDHSVLKLSDAFREADTQGLLELIVKVYNINQGRNPKILKKSRSLSEYAAFIARVRENMSKSKDWEEAVRKAVVYCIKHGIMKDFLEKNGSEVVNMLSVEFSLEDALRIRYEEGREEMQLQVVKEMIKDGDSPEKIARITKLPIETIQSIEV
jgi:predicted transposase/invertase (TIGR01784 family)